MEKKFEQSVVLRKRGRPAGKHRVPLSMEERRARNAQYERERRGEMSEALNDLAAAAGCQSSMTNADLLATVITQLRLASEIKHSSDLESLKRCNKNLMAQIAALEQRLAEPVDECKPLTPMVEAIRPSKRNREEYEPHAEDAGCTQVPKRIPPEYKYTPPLSPEQKYLPEPSSVYFSEQSLSPDQPLSPEQKYLPELSPVYFSEQSLSPDNVQVPEFKHVHEQRYSPEQKYSSHHEIHEFQPTSSQFLHYPTTSTQQFLPVPRLSPVSSSSDRQSPVQALDYSAYHFADPQIQTPEYQITEPSEYILPEASCSHGQAYYQHQSLPLRCHSGPSSPEDQFSPQQMVPEMQYEVPFGPPLSIPPLQHDFVGSVGFMPVSGASILPDIDEAELAPHRLNLLSTEDLISVYL